MVDISQKTLVKSLNDTLGAINANQAIAQLTAAQIAAERAGKPTGGPGAVLIGTDQVIAP